MGAWYVNLSSTDAGVKTDLGQRCRLTYEVEVYHCLRIVLDHELSVANVCPSSL